MIEDAPVISIIMPAFNAEQTLLASIKNVQQQTQKSWELIIINDASTDQTRVIAQTHAKQDSRIRIVDLSENSGVSQARNMGVEIARGNFIAFLDADDLWESTKLHKQLAFHLDHPNILISHTNYISFSNTGYTRRSWSQLFTPRGKKNGLLLPILYYRNIIGTLTVMMRKELFLQCGGFDSRLRVGEDYDLWLKVAKKKYTFGYLNERLAFYRISPNSLTKHTEKWKKQLKTILDTHLDTPGPFSNKAWGNYYRYFGTIHMKKGNFKLAGLYFSKSLLTNKFNIMYLTTVVYLAYSCFKFATRSKY